MSRSFLALLFAVAVTLHNLEEALFLPAWIRIHLKLRFDPNPKAYWIATSLATILVWVLALGALLSPATTAFHLALSGFALAVTINAFLPHLAVSLVKRSYSPGTATGVLLNLPLAVMLIEAELRTGLTSLVSFWLEAVIYAALLGLVVFGSLYLMHIIFRKHAET